MAVYCKGCALHLQVHLHKKLLTDCCSKNSALVVRDELRCAREQWRIQLTFISSIRIVVVDVVIIARRNKRFDRGEVLVRHCVSGRSRANDQRRLLQLFHFCHVFITIIVTFIVHKQLNHYYPGVAFLNL